MKQITPEDLLNNRFIKFTNDEKTRFKIIYPSKRLAEQWHLKTICILAGVDALRTIDLVRAVKLANFWMENKSKDDVLKIVFPNK